MASDFIWNLYVSLLLQTIYFRKTLAFAIVHTDLEWLHRCWWQYTVVDDGISIFVTSFGCWWPTLLFKNRGCWWRKRPKPSPTKWSPTQFVSNIHHQFTVMLLTILCWWLNDGNNFRMSVPDVNVKRKRISKMSPSYFVSNIHHQHRCILKWIHMQCNGYEVTAWSPCWNVTCSCEIPLETMMLFCKLVLCFSRPCLG